VKNKKSEDIKKAIAEVIAEGGHSEDAALERILQTLDRKKVLRYHRSDEVSLISTPGRVLIALIEDPTMTIRAISVYLDLSETMIDKTIKQLISGGLILKTKTNRKNLYKVNISSVLNQPDIQHMMEIIQIMVSEPQQKNKPSEVVDHDSW
jgi:predicted transcriptional regulator